MDGILIKLYFWRLYPNLWWSTPTAPSVDYDVGSGGGSPTNTGFRSKTGYIYIYIYIIRVLKIIKMDIFMTIYWNILPVYWDTMEHSMG